MNIIKKLIQRNFTLGRNGYQIKRIVLHTYGGPGRSLYNLFNTPNLKNPRSTHYAIFKDGGVEQYVEEENMSWGAGTQTTKDHPNNNWESISIEHQDDGNPNDSIRSEELYESSAQLVADICRRRGIPCILLSKDSKWDSGIVLHNYYANKSCPAGLHVDRIVQRANTILRPPTIVFGQKPILVSIESGDGYTKIAKKAGWSYWDEPERVIAELRALNPEHPSFSRGNHIYNGDPAFIVGYDGVKQPGIVPELEARNNPETIIEESLNPEPPVPVTVPQIVDVPLPTPEQIAQPENPTPKEVVQMAVDPSFDFRISNIQVSPEAREAIIEETKPYIARFGEWWKRLPRFWQLTIPVAVVSFFPDIIKALSGLELNDIKVYVPWINWTITLTQVFLTSALGFVIATLGFALKKADEFIIQNYVRP